MNELVVFGIIAFVITEIIFIYERMDGSYESWVYDKFIAIVGGITLSMVLLGIYSFFQQYPEFKTHAIITVLSIIVFFTLNYFIKVAIDKMRGD